MNARTWLMCVIGLMLGWTSPVFAQDVSTPMDTSGTQAAEKEPAAPGDGAGEGTNEEELIIPKIVLYGNGKVSSPDANPDDITASGGFGLGYVSTLLQFHLTVHKGDSNEVGASLDEDAEVSEGSANEYGYTILEPSSASTSYSARAYWYPIDLKQQKNLRLQSRFGAGGYIMASNITWVYPSATEGELSKRDVTSFAFAPCLSVIGRGQAGDNIATLFANLCTTFRVIGGDIATDDSDDLRENLIGTKTKYFGGPELEVGAQLGNLGISARVLYLSGGDADGLSGLRFIPVISGTVPVGFPLKAL